MAKAPKSLYDRELEKLAGLRPLSLPTGYDPELKRQLEETVRRQDMAQHNKRYKWYCIPTDIDENLLETLLYMRGQVCMFYYEKLNKFYFLPFALSGSIDAYSRYNRIKPVVIGTTGSSDGKDKDEESIFDKDVILDVVKTVLSQEDEDALTYEDIVKSAVILRDYTPEVYRQTVEPRYQTVAPLIKMEVEQMLWARTASENGCGTTAFKVPDSATADQVLKLNQKLYTASQGGDKFIPVETSMVKETDAVDSLPTFKPQEYLQTYQSLDNYRLQTLGLSNGGVFEKQGTILQDEYNQNVDSTQQILLDGLRIRQMFCCIANQIFGTSIWCEINDELKQMLPPEDIKGRSENVDVQTAQGSADAEGVGGEVNETNV